MVEILDIPQRDAYVVFPGRNTKQMLKLIEQGRTPITMYEFARQRLLIRDLYNTVNQNPEQYPELRQKVQDAYTRIWVNPGYADTGDMWLRQSAKQEGKGKVVLYNAQVLDFLKKNLNPKRKLTNLGALAFDGELEGAYDSFTGDNVLELNKAEIDNFFGRPNTRQGAKDSAFWKFTLGDLTNDYADAVFTDGEHSEAMGTYVADAEDVPTGRLWYVDWLRYWSGADGRDHLDNYDGRLVGVAPEARVARGSPAKTLEQRV